MPVRVCGHGAHALAVSVIGEAGGRISLHQQIRLQLGILRFRYQDRIGSLHLKIRHAFVVQIGSDRGNLLRTQTCKQDGVGPIVHNNGKNYAGQNQRAQHTAQNHPRLFTQFGEKLLKLPAKALQLLPQLRYPHLNFRSPVTG
ncbi:hypothetical protein SDC9_100578 [bioreactor metagenome]|uniref:Uncharacterized protein n=1 Tax=bioreactor metagenome TaxID=1076179 RepID=A0A645AKZ1_9ZZZZ